MYDGEWVANTKHGKGKEIHPNGNIYDVEWDNDKKLSTIQQIFSIGKYVLE